MRNKDDEVRDVIDELEPIKELKKENMDLSYLKNTLIAYRKGEFEKINLTADQKVHIRLDGYAIIPIEVFGESKLREELIKNHCLSMKIIQMGIDNQQKCLNLI